MLIEKRYTIRLSYDRLAQLQHQGSELNKEYTKLELENGTYSSSLVLQDFAINKLGLVLPDKNHIVEVK